MALAEQLTCGLLVFPSKLNSNNATNNGPSSNARCRLFKSSARTGTKRPGVNNNNNNRSNVERPRRTTPESPGPLDSNSPHNNHIPPNNADIWQSALTWLAQMGSTVTYSLGATKLVKRVSSSPSGNSHRNAYRNANYEDSIPATTQVGSGSAGASEAPKQTRFSYMSRLKNYRRNTSNGNYNDDDYNNCNSSNPNNRNLSGSGVTPEPLDTPTTNREMDWVLPVSPRLSASGDAFDPILRHFLISDRDVDIHGPDVDGYASSTRHSGRHSGNEPLRGLSLAQRSHSHSLGLSYDDHSRGSSGGSTPSSLSRSTSGSGLQIQTAAQTGVTAKARTADGITNDSQRRGNISRSSGSRRSSMLLAPYFCAEVPLARGAAHNADPGPDAADEAEGSPPIEDDNNDNDLTTSSLDTMPTLISLARQQSDPRSFAETLYLSSGSDNYLIVDPMTRLTTTATAAAAAAAAIGSDPTSMRSGAPPNQLPPRNTTDSVNYFTKPFQPTMQSIGDGDSWGNDFNIPVTIDTDIMPGLGYIS